MNDASFVDKIGVNDEFGKLFADDFAGLVVLVNVKGEFFIRVFLELLESPVCAAVMMRKEHDSLDAVEFD